MAKDGTTDERQEDETPPKMTAVEEEAEIETHSQEGNDVAPSTTGESTSGPKKKKRSAKKKIKEAFGGKKDDEEASKLSSEAVQALLKSNPSLEQQVSGMSKGNAEELLKKLSITDLLTGMTVSGKNKKDMASYKFWQTQPVPRFDEPPQEKDGPFKVIDPEQTPKEPGPMADGFEWVTVDITNEKELEDVHELLTGHYVEDEAALFRFNYSASFIGWALRSPGWRKDWHVGVRAIQSKKLVAFISGVPLKLRVRGQILETSEINFLCVHKKLRSKRLAPVLIKEITRQSHLINIQQAIYTAGVVLPKPVSTCRYYHRMINWEKLHEVGFCHLPPGSTIQRQITRNHIPSATSTPGLRLMEAKDLNAVQKLLLKYLRRFDIAPQLSKEEVEHLLLHQDEMCPERVVWTYVVEDPTTHKITDFFSFYRLESRVIKSKKYDTIKAAYLFYYATESAFPADGKRDNAALKPRLNALVGDALVSAKKLGFDVLNALTMMDNPLFLENQRFGAGDGQLHYYLYNYRTKPVPGGINHANNVDEKFGRGVGMVML